jgi:hypothetical protein
MKQRIYIDTSVFGGYYDREFDAVKFMRQQRDRLSSMLSKMTKEEIIEYFRKKASDTTVKPYC